MATSKVQSRSCIVREKKTIAMMIDIYCRAKHGGTKMCGPCSRLLEYAYCRLDRCPFGAKKTPCAQCPVHCYSPTMRTRIKEVMRFSGPRMTYRHPILVLLHHWDRLRNRGERES